MSNKSSAESGSADSADQPFEPAAQTGAAIDMVILNRIAHALEYIAVHLGKIHERLTKQEEEATLRATKSMQETLAAETARLRSQYGKQLAG
jgi:hypothetical protein